MKNILKLFTLEVLSACLSGLVCQAAIDKKMTDEVNAAISAFKQSDRGMTKLFNDATGYVVFPSVGKGGLIVGGAHGKGLVYEQGKLIGATPIPALVLAPAMVFNEPRDEQHNDPSVYDDDF